MIYLLTNKKPIMKSIFRIFLFVLAITAFSGNLYAQKENRQRMTREQLAEVQAQYIARQMAMDDATAQKFTETFRQFQKEVWALGPRGRKGASNHSDAEIEQALKERFAHSQKILDLRKKYYTKYSKFLTQRQIERIYKLERHMMKRLNNRHKSHQK